MKCPSCGMRYALPESILAYYDRQIKCWAEAAVYRCSKCARSEFSKMPLGSVVENSKGLLREPWRFYKGDLMMGIVPRNADDDFFNEQWHPHGIWCPAMDKAEEGMSFQKNGQYLQAMTCAVEFCRALDGELDLQWYGWSLGWALSLDERPELGGQVKEYRKMHLHCCLTLREEMKNEELDYKAELMAVLEAETARIEWLVRGRGRKPLPDLGQSNINRSGGDQPSPQGVS